MLKKIILSCLSLLAFFLLAACQHSDAGGQAIEEQTISPGAKRGYLTLEINPKLTMEYDRSGKITDIFGLNQEGVDVVDDLEDMIGKNSQTALKEIVQTIYQKGYLVDKEKNEINDINLELEAGSVIPQDDFLKQMTHAVEQAISQLEIDLSLSQDDLISLDQAKKIALDHAKVKEDDAEFKEKEYQLDIDDQTQVEDLNYHLEFRAKGHYHSYHINAINGDIKKHEKKAVEKSSSEDSNKKSKSDSKKQGQASNVNGNESRSSHSSQNSQVIQDSSQQVSPSAPPARSHSSQYSPAVQPPPPPYDDDDDDDDYDYDDDDDDDDDDD